MLRWLQSRSYTLILWTCREGQVLGHAKRFLWSHHVNKLMERDSKIQERRDKARMLREQRKREKELELYNKLKSQFEEEQ